MTEVDALIQEVERSRNRLLASVGPLTEVQAAFKSDDGQWSVAEVLEHLYLAELAGVTKIWSALEDVRAGRTWTESKPNQGQPIEEVVAATWKTKETAPPIATPHIGGPLEFWLFATQSLPPILAALGLRLREVPLEDVVFPHFLSGPLDARQRLEFLRFHIERHAAQIGRVRNAPGFPR